MTTSINIFELLSILVAHKLNKATPSRDELKETLENWCTIRPTKEQAIRQLMNTNLELDEVIEVLKSFSGVDQKKIQQWITEGESFLNDYLNLN